MDPEPRTDGGVEKDDRRIHVGRAVNGPPVWLPVEKVLTGRAFLTGKSGSGKSNTASVVVEELLERAYPVLIVDTDGEYYGLKEEYELLHAGADEECDVQVDVEHAEKLAELALEENVPIILDVSGYLDEEVSNGLIRETARHLFAKEKKLKKPFLMVVEEIHEYVPEGGGMDETGKMLIKVGKRGRKHGLGIVGISQRPADVKKDFITQANWLVWHRLTWENDTKVVRRIVGDKYGEAVADLDPGEAFVQLDWTDRDVRRVQFKRKRTFDAGATPGLEDFERPELKSVDGGLMENLSSITERQEREQDRIEHLEARLDEKDDRIAELEGELERARNVSAAAEQVAEAVADEVPESVQTRLGAKNQEIDRLHDRIAELEDRLERVVAALPAEERLERLAGDAGASSDRDEDGPSDLEAFLGRDDDPDSLFPDGEATDDPETLFPDEEDGTDDPLFPDAAEDEVVPADAADGGGLFPDEGGDGDGSTGGAGAGSPATGEATTGSDGEPASDPPEDFLADYEGIGPYLEAAREGDGESPDGAVDLRPERPGKGRRDTRAADTGEARGDESPEASDDAIRRSVDAAAADGTGGADDADGSADEADPDPGAVPPGEDAEWIVAPPPGADDAQGSGDGGPGGNGAAERTPDPVDPDRVADLLRATPVAVKLRAAVREARCNESDARELLAALTDGAALTVPEAAESVGATQEGAYSLLSALRARDLATRDGDHRYALDADGMERIVETADDRSHLGELRAQWQMG